ncbi:hypothetical protein NB689_002672 [Xanthomonas sacchari]|nr:hypothetical protein [Xanthomonas sacchari]
MPVPRRCRCWPRIGWHCRRRSRCGFPARRGSVRCWPRPDSTSRCRPARAIWRRVRRSARAMRPTGSRPRPRSTAAPPTNRSGAPPVRLPPAIGWNLICSARRPWTMYACTSIAVPRLRANSTALRRARAPATRRRGCTCCSTSTPACGRPCRARCAMHRSRRATATASVSRRCARSAGVCRSRMPAHCAPGSRSSRPMPAAPPCRRCTATRRRRSRPGRKTAAVPVAWCAWPGGSATTRCRTARFPCTGACCRRRPVARRCSSSRRRPPHRCASLCPAPTPCSCRPTTAHCKGTPRSW